jgi:hypothetical protein
MKKKFPSKIAVECFSGLGVDYFSARIGNAAGGGKIFCGFCGRKD